MSPQSNSTVARLLVPIALVACALALLITIGSSLGGGGGEDSGASQPASRPSSKPDDSRRDAAQPQARSRERSGTYTVKAGDTPGSIAGDVGITVDRLLELNPELDPNSLVAGQKIKLRE